MNPKILEALKSMELPDKDYMIPYMENNIVKLFKGNTLKTIEFIIDKNNLWKTPQRQG